MSPGFFKQRSTLSTWTHWAILQFSIVITVVSILGRWKKLNFGRNSSWFNSSAQPINSVAVDWLRIGKYALEQLELVWEQIEFFYIIYIPDRACSLNYFDKIFHSDRKSTFYIWMFFVKINWFCTYLGLNYCFLLLLLLSKVKRHFS